MKFEIRNRWNGNIQYKCDLDVALDTAAPSLRLGAAIKIAYNSGADLSDADLRGADLRGADLRGADLSGADLRGAVLRGTVLRGAVLSGTVLRDAVLRDAVLRGTVLRGAVLSGADLSGADLRGTVLRGADLRGAVLSGAKISAIKVFTGLYCYQVWAVLFQNGSRWVRMGCLFKSLEDWEKIGIRKSNVAEFPDDGSPQCEERVRAFEFAKNAALEMKLLAE